MPARDRPECVYSVLVSRAEGRPRAGFWPIALDKPLPVVSIPLRDGDADAQLDLRAIIDRVYDEAGLRFFLYDRPPYPALDDAAALWAAEIRSMSANG
jgi:hypothetical protein